MVQHFREAPSSIVAELQLHKAGGTRKYVTFSYTSDVVQKAYTDTDMPSQSFGTTTFHRSTCFIRRQKFRQINLLHNNQFRKLSVLSLNDKPKHRSSTIRTEVHFLLHKNTLDIRYQYKMVTVLQQYRNKVLSLKCDLKISKTPVGHIPIGHS